jgi:hypothetical protein
MTDMDGDGVVGPGDLKAVIGRLCQHERGLTPSEIDARLRPNSCQSSCCSLSLILTMLLDAYIKAKVKVRSSLYYVSCNLDSNIYFIKFCRITAHC